MKAEEAIRRLYPDSSKRTLQNWLRSGRFTVDGRVLKRFDEELGDQDVVVAKESCKAPKVPHLKILYEDRSIVVIDKPVGLLSVPLDEDVAPKRHALGLLREWLRSDDIFAVHRIDREASGVLLFAKGKKAASVLGDRFETHDLKREYLAIVEGRLKQGAGVWDTPLLELPSFRVVPSTEGREAITHFQVIRKSTKYSYLRVLLETGRKHQIRVHCQQAGHPIVGDERYGAKDNPFRRLALHAHTLSVVHPLTGKMMTFTAPLPKSFLVLGFSEV
ncbi:MAG: ribosomal large subunit pseudouridine synthase [Chlamydiota bacterium]|jgi:tRNA pseudouridine32 synthase/23S rRNA pseudouridine746 synthase/23S rRNA pseudouridine1911/1915/1917 synthase